MTLINNLRFPGQYYDEETGLHYNYFRDYKPMIGRYVEADPIGLKKGENHVYVYVSNTPGNDIDPMGLAIWICSRRTKFGVGNHAYRWNDRDNTCCGTGSTKSCKEEGPNGDSCRKVAGSDGLEDKVMKCCKDTGDKGIWVPPINDCHTHADDCLKGSGLGNPGAPGGRFGHR